MPGCPRRTSGSTSASRPRRCPSSCPADCSQGDRARPPLCELVERILAMVLTGPNVGRSGPLTNLQPCRPSLVRKHVLKLFPNAVMDDVRWLSYEETADALAITLDSARVI